MAAPRLAVMWEIPAFLFSFLQAMKQMAVWQVQIIALAAPVLGSSNFSLRAVCLWYKQDVILPFVYFSVARASRIQPMIHFRGLWQACHFIITSSRTLDLFLIQLFGSHGISSSNLIRKTQRPTSAVLVQSLHHKHHILQKQGQKIQRELNLVSASYVD